MNQVTAPGEMPLVALPQEGIRRGGLIAVVQIDVLPMHDAPGRKNADGRQQGLVEGSIILFAQRIHRRQGKFPAHRQLAALVEDDIILDAQEWKALIPQGP